MGSHSTTAAVTSLTESGDGKSYQQAKVWAVHLVVWEEKGTEERYKSTMTHEL